MNLENNKSNLSINEEQLKDIESDLTLLESETESEYHGVLKQFYKEISKIPLLSFEEEKVLAERMYKGDREAKEEMINRNLRLAVHLAKKYYRSEADTEDLIQEACIGLIRATDTYNPDLGYRFSTYAYCWIRQSMGRYMDNNFSTIRIPVHVRDKIRKLNRWSTKYNLYSGVEPTEEEVKEKCKELEMSYETLLSYTNMSVCPSLNQVITYGDDSDTELGDMLRSDISVEKEVLNIDRADVVDELMSIILTEKEKEVIKMRFYDTLTLEECGNILGCTRERVRQIESKAMRKLRTSWRRHKISNLIRVDY